ncbi:ergothioneine biosynthesis protein EgtB [Novosphingobium mangrovi (ex Hu et al. 2023)]|uniref:Ergothioneine biosynthesis protein EgtB n=1 Tax=Novosphingobium mangrovi (ex Hu et al. 2023) TaxID=2930094 RepID=A0ABT0AGY6_9SPHN|nr:ergothioneine biosynthesis protein EgtB [Novosphingobium mangrovi (ex Hu et al. 2023)]MCJ1962476.1 ergothioneine biosynthesis protein EgtB [Novosphingobium mangrovi (ex Hu et al. 2023)]
MYSPRAPIASAATEQVRAGPPDLTHFRTIRDLSVALASGLNEADATVQSMPDASPVKWHLAHTTWFFETFLLRDTRSDYRLFDEKWPFLFNSYYEAEGARLARPQRGLLTRPTLEEVLAYRAHVDAALERVWPDLQEHHAALLELGLQHEQQHQELLLTDLKHLLSCNPLGPSYREEGLRTSSCVPADLKWIEGPTGARTFGHTGEGFAFDNEGPAHTQWLAPHALANRPVTNREWCAFIADGGYATASLWLSDGWDWVRREGVAAPLYWREEAEPEARETFTLSGWQMIDLDAPVTHISFYEADAYATWAGARLPTEQEWEAAASAHAATGGVQLDRAEAVHPRGVLPEGDFASLFGNVWEWTGSAYRPWPGFRPAPGAVGEYNGKFMSNQFVLRGGSCASPRGHVRATYRNFFHPHQRWQFTGLRLARDL